MQKLRTVGVLAGTFALVVLGAATALGGDRLKTKSATVDVAYQEHGSAVAKCASGTKAVSGGWEVPPVEFKGSPQLNVDQSSRAGGRRWSTEATNFTPGSDPGALTSYVYCRDEKVRSKKVTESIASNTTETITAKCKRGTKAVSGGFNGESTDFSAPSPNIGPRVSRKVGARKWEVTATNGGGVAGDLTVQVNCREGKPLKTRSSSETLDGIQDVELDAECKRDERVVSGGFAHPDTTLLALESKRTGKRGWHFAASASQELTVYAYCEPKS